MTAGWFTGKKLGDYFNGEKTDWRNARRIINALDKADTIAGYAKTFYTALLAASDGTVQAVRPLPDVPGPEPVARVPDAVIEDHDETDPVVAQPAPTGGWGAVFLAIIKALFGRN